MKTYTIMEATKRIRFWIDMVPGRVQTDCDSRMKFVLHYGQK